MSGCAIHESGSPDRDCAGTVRVVLRAGTTVRRVDVWAGTRTQLVERPVTGRHSPRQEACRKHVRSPEQPTLDLALGEVVTTARGREPAEGTLFLVGEAGLEPLSYADAWDRVDPAGAGERALDREHAARADASHLPRELTRFVGVHGLKDGVHPVAISHYYAERCTARQAYWRRATRAEVEALGEPGARAQVDTCM